MITNNYFFKTILTVLLFINVSALHAAMNINSMDTSSKATTATPSLDDTKMSSMSDLEEGLAKQEKRLTEEREQILTKRIEQSYERLKQELQRQKKEAAEKQRLQSSSHRTARERLEKYINYILFSMPLEDGLKQVNSCHWELAYAIYNKDMATLKILISSQNTEALKRRLYRQIDLAGTKLIDILFWEADTEIFQCLQAKGLTTQS